MNHVSWNSCFVAGLLSVAIPLSAGVPDRDLRLITEADRTAFRSWFTFLAEAQYFTPPEKRSPEIVDCASLLRYAFHEALRLHDSAWAAQSGLPLLASIPSVEKYNYPRTPLGPRVFRVSATNFAEFADAQTLYRYNVRFVSRNVRSAQPADLLFYRRAAGSSPFHTMIVLGHSQITRDSSRFVVYDTGPDGTRGGVMKRLTVEDLLRFPDPQWRPVRENSAFLGVFRWNILQSDL